MSRRIAIEDRLRRAVAEREREGLARQVATVHQREGALLVADGEVLVDFSSNDYLGLRSDLEGVAALQEAAAWHGVGAGASAMVSGRHIEQARLEADLAEFLDYPRALVVGSGYLANIGAMAALLERGDLCVQDRLVHASLIDGARLAGARLARYAHCSVEGAVEAFATGPGQPALLATDAVFSMDGTTAPLAELALLARAERALLYVDDAHGFGICGPEGRGSVPAAKLGAREVPLLMVGFGKALGGYGAAILGPEDLIEGLAQMVRTVMFSTAMPPALAAANRQLLGQLATDAWRRFRLAGIIARFKRAAQQHQIDIGESDSPIQPVMIGDNAATMRIAAKLKAAGFLVGAIRPPSVPHGSSRLRISLSTLHTDEQVDGLVAALAQLLPAETRSESGEPAASRGSSTGRRATGDEPNLLPTRVANFGA